MQGWLSGCRRGQNPFVHGIFHLDRLGRVLESWPRFDPCFVLCRSLVTSSRARKPWWNGETAGFCPVGCPVSLLTFPFLSGPCFVTGNRGRSDGCLNSGPILGWSSESPGDCAEQCSENPWCKPVCCFVLATMIAESSLPKLGGAFIVSTSISSLTPLVWGPMKQGRLCRSRRTCGGSAPRLGQ